MAQRRTAPAQQRPQQQRPAPAPANDIPISSPPQYQQTQAAPATTLEALNALVAYDESSLVKPEVGALEAISRSEIAMQLDSAHRYPRSVTKFLKEAQSLATFSVEVAETCFYELPARAGGNGEKICGPSVRLAEMCATAWGNLHIGARVIDVTAREVIAQAVAWDLERNVRITVETPRSILTKTGGRFGDSMIQTTGLAALSISLRNAVFRVIPRTYVDAVYAAARNCARGSLQTLAARRDMSFEKYAGLGVTRDRIFAKFGIKGVDDFTLEHQESLVGMYNAIRAGELTVAEAFPVAQAAPEQQRSKGSVLKDIVSQAKKSEPPPAAPAAAPPLTWTKLQAELGAADGAWEGEDRLPLIMAWTPEQARLAWDWATANNDPSIQDEEVPERPAFTVLPAERQPGED